MNRLFTLLGMIGLFVLFTPSNDLFANSNPSPENLQELNCEIAGELSIHPTCKDTDNGIILVNMTGGTPPFVYNWSNGAPDDFDALIELSPGDYSVTITDAEDCTLELSGTVSESTFFFANAESVNVSGPGASDGSVTANPSGGAGPYNYYWNDPGNSETATVENLPVGDYTVTVIDGSDCESIQTVRVNAADCAVNVANTVIQISCFGECDGQSGVMAGGGEGPYSYEWNTGSTASHLDNLCEGLYTVSVTDSEGCVGQNTIQIIEPDLLELEIESVHHIGCFGVNNGSITVQPIGGTAPFNYSWSNNGGASNNIEGLAIGTYSVTVVDGGGCSASISIDITQAPELVISVENNNPVDCYGAATGSAAVSASGGTGAYTFNWSNGGEGTNLEGLPAGDYTVTVTDENNCTDEISFEITEPQELTAGFLNSANVSCFGADDGFISVVTGGGTPGYAYEWSNGESDSMITGLGPDTYSLTVTDGNGCTETISMDITEPTALELTQTNLENVSCFEAGDGSIEISGSGGTMPLSFNWSNGDTGTTVDNLVPGNYTVTLADGNGCVEQLSATITEPPLLEVNTVVTNVDCPGSTQGSIAATATGGTEGYTYLWSNGSNVNPIFSLTAGDYSLTVTDANGCTVATDVTIGSLDEIAPTVFANDVNLFLGEDGTVTLPLGQVNNGSFDNCGIASMSLSITEFDCTQVGDNTVTLTVTDQSGNSSTAEVTVSVSDLIAPSMTCPENIIVPACEANVVYELPVVEDNCADAFESELVSGLPSGATFPEGLTVVSYSYTDGGNNSALCSFEVTVKPAMATEIEEQHVSCNGEHDGEISVNVTGGEPDYEYTWEGGFTGPVLESLPAGEYNLTVTDADGCANQFNFQILEPNPLSIQVDQIVDETDGQSNGSIDITPLGGTGPYTFEWLLDGEVVSTSGDLAGVPAGDYKVVVTDANGCQFTSELITVKLINGTDDVQINVGFDISPNPAGSLINLSFETEFTQLANISIWNILGQKAADGMKVSSGTRALTIDVSNLSDGTYLLRLDTKAGSYLRKFVVSRK